MTSLLHKIAPKNIVIAGIYLLVALVSVQSALADRSKKATDKSKKSTSTALRYVSPESGAMEVAVTALGRQISTKQASKISVATDTNKKDSRIVFVRANADLFTARVDIAFDESNLELGIYNMLGKKMADVYRGPATRGEHDYNTSISDLPEGVYICILQTSNSRRAEKFYLSR